MVRVIVSQYLGQFQKKELEKKDHGVHEFLYGCEVLS